MADEDDSQKTEDPSRKRLEEAAERGQSANSREAASFFLLLVFTMLFISLLPSYMTKAKNSLAIFIERPESFLVENNMGAILKDSLFMSINLLIIPLLACVIAVIASSLIQGRMIFSSEPLVPKLEKISILKGIERLFSLKSLVEFLKLQ
jgi:flagellar biosynthesis protein FlhB